MSGRVGSITTDIIADGLIFNMDPANRASYPRTGGFTYNTINMAISGALSDSGGGGNDNPQFNSSNSGVFDFDGVDDYIQFDKNTGNFGLNGPFTISAWFKGENLVDSYSNIYAIINKFSFNNNSGWSFFLRGGTQNGYAFRSGYDAATSSSALDVSPSPSLVSYLYDDNWHNITITQDSSRNATAHIDYTYTATRTYEDNHSNSNNLNLKVGVGTSSNSQPFLGKIACIQIYSNTLSSQEVLHNYNSLKERFGL
jgi:hypothetical protein